MQSYFSHFIRQKMCLIQGEGEKTESPKISQEAFADRTVSSNLTQTHLKPPDSSDIKEL